MIKGKISRKAGKVRLFLTIKSSFLVIFNFDRSKVAISPVQHKGRGL